MYHSKGFSFIEVVLALALSSIIILIFMQNISVSKKFLEANPFLEVGTSTSLVSRGLGQASGILLSYPDDSVGKRDCSLGEIPTLPSVVVPKYEGFNGSVTSVHILGDILVAGMNSATSSDPDVVVIDTGTWKVLATLNTGPGLAWMIVQGHYLFLANTSVNAQFQAVDISNPSLPVLVNSFKIPGSTSSNSKKNPVITSISSSPSGGIFLGSQKSDLGEVFVADFDGTTFSFVASYNPGSIVNDVFADSSGVWVTSPSDNELFHYNTSGTVDQVYDANGQSGNGKRIDILGKNFKLLGRTFGHEELVQVGSVSKIIGGSIDDLLIATDSKGDVYVLILARVSGISFLKIWNTTRIDEEILLGSQINSIPLPTIADRIGCGGNTIFIGTASSSQPFVTIL